MASNPIIAISSTSQLAVEAGQTVSEHGGNAVDAAVAAALVSLITEPGVVALGGGGYVTIWPEKGQPVTLDGYMALPGMGTGNIPSIDQMQEATMEYGGGVTTYVGHASVCTPGALKALEHAVEKHGKLDWEAVVQPAIEIAKTGFPLSKACHNYLIYAHQLVFGHCDASYRALHDKNGGLLKPGDTVFLEDLEQSLIEIAKNGTDAFYTGTLADLILEDMALHDGALDRTDLASYQVIERPALLVDFCDWQLATNPPPAVGGVTLGAMLLCMQNSCESAWSAKARQALINTQEFVLRYRRERLDSQPQDNQESTRLLDLARDYPEGCGSPSTVHTSTVDQNHLACSITLSAGYGSGVIPKSTGIWLNNSLGELELNRGDPDTLRPGARMLSNMAPTVVKKPAHTLSIGSPGADRITTALAQTLIGHLKMDMSLKAAVDQPRIHLEWLDDQLRIAYEDLVKLPDQSMPVRTVQGLDMYFGGVGVTSLTPRDGFQAVADPRRTGATLITGNPHG